MLFTIRAKTDLNYNFKCVNRLHVSNCKVATSQYVIDMKAMAVEYM